MSEPIRPNYGTGLAFLALLGTFLFAQYDDYRHEWPESQELEAAQQDAQALASREFAGRQVCGPGAEAYWESDKTLVCTPKRGQPYQVAAKQAGD